MGQGYIGLASSEHLPPVFPACTFTQGEEGVIFQRLRLSAR